MLANLLIKFLALPSLKTGSSLSLLLFQHLQFSVTKIAVNMPMFYFVKRKKAYEELPCCILRRGAWQRLQNVKREK